MDPFVDHYSSSSSAKGKARSSTGVVRGVEVSVKHVNE